jgi:hypothetical protein
VEEQNMTLTTEMWRDQIVPEASNVLVTCPDCETRWILTKREADWFTAKLLKVPRRCPACRVARRQQEQTP